LKFDQQKHIVASRSTLPIACCWAMLVWLVELNSPTYILGGEDGFWHILGDGERFLKSVSGISFVGDFLCLAFLALSVYLMAEFNSNFVLLRIRSRILSTIMVVLFAASTFIHSFQPANVLPIFLLMSYFALFSTYQRSRATYPAFLSFAWLSIGSMIFPKILILVPFYWGIQIYQRSLSFKSFTATLIGLIAPYWFLFFYSLSADGLTSFMLPFRELVNVEMPDYSTLSMPQILTGGFTFLLFLVSTLNYAKSSFNDKTRVRLLYTSIIILGVAMFLLMVLQPQCYNPAFGLALVNTSILAGRYFASNDTRFSNIFFLSCILVVLALTVYNVFIFQD